MARLFFRFQNPCSPSEQLRMLLFHGTMRFRYHLKEAAVWKAGCIVRYGPCRWGLLYICCTAAVSLLPSASPPFCSSSGAGGTATGCFWMPAPAGYVIGSGAGRAGPVNSSWTPGFAGARPGWSCWIGRNGPYCNWTPLHPMEASIWKKANGISSAGRSTGPPEPAPCAGEVCSAPPETDPGSEPPSAKMREWDAPSHGSPVGASAAATPFCFHRPEK